jgi:hypothetical protein
MRYRKKKNHPTRAMRDLKMPRTRRNLRKKRRRRKSWKILRRSSRRVSANISQLLRWNIYYEYLVNSILVEDCLQIGWVGV